MSGLEIIALGATLASGAMTAAGQVQQGRQQQAMANWEAGQIEQRGIAEAGAAQRKGEVERRKGEELIARQRVGLGTAAGIGSGLDVIARTDEQARYNQDVAIWEGDEAKRGRYGDAAVKRTAGAAAAAAGRTSAIATGLSTIGSAGAAAMRMPNVAAYMRSASAGGGIGHWSTISTDATGTVI